MATPDKLQAAIDSGKKLLDLLNAEQVAEMNLEAEQAMLAAQQSKVDLAAATVSQADADEKAQRSDFAQKLAELDS